jgi:[glutamine synthetase] adenylyltransferase / [glutamine synthetase]-adenylyl-L-tyrosine phosphorylase
MPSHSIHDLLLAARLPPDSVAALLRPYGFHDPAAADRNLQQAAEDPRARELIAAILPDLLDLAARSADPDQALSRLERFLRASISPLEILTTLRDRPRILDLMVVTLGASSFMAEILVRNPEWFHWLSGPGVLDGPRTAAEIGADLGRVLATLQTDSRRLDALRVAKRREILHVGVRDLLRLSSVEETVGALSELGEALIQGAYEMAERRLREERGLRPLPPDRAKEGSGFVVVGMGKLGAGELNFSSDVDLVYVYSSDRGRVERKAAAPSRTEWARALSRSVTSALADTTGEGAVYRVDLRLRPEGRVGPIAHAVPSMERYYRSRGATWERLAWLRAWPVGGDRTLGRRLLQRVRPFVFSGPFGPEEVGRILELKRSIDRKMAEQGQSTRNVKLGVGGIREIELATQALQVRHGRTRPRLRERRTTAALAALREARLIPSEEADALAKAYLFLRDVENKLQMVADAQVHSLPEKPGEVRACALRLGYRDSEGLPAGDALLGDYRRVTEGVHRIFGDVFQRLAVSRGSDS